MAPRSFPSNPLRAYGSPRAACAFAAVLAVFASPRLAPAAPGIESPPALNHVVMVSIDGLLPAVLDASAAERFPTLARLMRGPHTLEARTDPDATITLPNHVSMVTGVPVQVHGWQWNDDPPAIRHGGSIHARAGRYIPSCFDVAHDRGVSTGLFASKTKFWLLEQSYGSSSGAKDEVSPDHGRAKIDLVAYSRSSGELVPQLAARLSRAAARSKRTLDFLHMAEPDSAGHAHEWDLTPGSKYLQAIERCDRWLGELLAAIESDERLRGRVAILLTTDHGGGVPEKTHTDPTAPENFRIPFLVWLGSDREAVDLYAINTGVRAKPGPKEQPDADSTPPPIRNGDIGNLALQLLGLPPIPGSLHNGSHDLRIVLEEEQGAGEDMSGGPLRRGSAPPATLPAP